MATFSLVEEICSKLPQAKLVKVEGADHNFKAGKQDIMSTIVNYTRNRTEEMIRS